MADAEIEEVKSRRVTLVMDEEEAGYLLNALSRHLAGTLVSADKPLGQIRTALKKAKVGEIPAWRIKGFGNYAALYANYEDIPQRDRADATQGFSD